MLNYFEGFGKSGKHEASRPLPYFLGLYFSRARIGGARQRAALSRRLKGDPPLKGVVNHREIIANFWPINWGNCISARNLGAFLPFALPFQIV